MRTEFRAAPDVEAAPGLAGGVEREGNGQGKALLIILSTGDRIG
jgi:hypothetical protein